MCEECYFQVVRVYTHISHLFSKELTLESAITLLLLYILMTLHEVLLV